MFGRFKQSFEVEFCFNLWTSDEFGTSKNGRSKLGENHSCSQSYQIICPQITTIPSPIAYPNTVASYQSCNQLLVGLAGQQCCCKWWESLFHGRGGRSGWKGCTRSGSMARHRYIPCCTSLHLGSSPNVRWPGSHPDICNRSIGKPV